MIFNHTLRIIDHQGKWSPHFLGTFLYSAVLTLFVEAMRTRSAWWPFHPLAIPLCTGWTVIVLWFPFFVDWVLKMAILRYRGGAFFLGLILGESTMAVLIGIICTANPNIQPPWFPIL